MVQHGTLGALSRACNSFVQNGTVWYDCFEIQDSLPVNGISPSLRPLVALVCGAIKPDADDINDDSVKRITDNINGDRIENEVQ